MTHVRSRRIKRYYSCFIYLLIGSAFYLAVSLARNFRSRTCSITAYDNQTIDYYDEWQYRNSLTGQWHQWHVTSDSDQNDITWKVKWFNAEPDSYLGVIVYLTRHGEIDSLRTSLTQLAKLLVDHPRPVAIFHEGDFNDNDTQHSLAQILAPYMPLCFEHIHFTNSSKQPRSVHRTIHAAYYHMCRFFSSMILYHPLVKQFQYYWRLDAHSFIFASTPIKDPFEIMRNQRIQYAFIMANEDDARYATELWSVFQQFLRQRCLRSSPAVDKTQVGWFRSYSLAMIFTNFAIANVSLFRDHQLIRAWLQTAENHGGIYRYRWGDAPIHTLALTQFLPRQDIVRFRYFGYMHQREYVCAYGIRGEACRKQMEPFIRDQTVKYLEYDDGCFPSSFWNPLCHYYRDIRL